MQVLPCNEEVCLRKPGGLKIPLNGFQYEKIAIETVDVKCQVLHHFLIG